MKPSLLQWLVCPTCHAELDLRDPREDQGEIQEGRLVCASCAKEYRIVRGVPRFVDPHSYADSFGFQWNKFRTVQIDSLNGTRQSEQTLEATTGWRPADYAQKLVLDAGVGAGRFAEVAARHGAEVIGFDLSAAVDAAQLNVGRQPRVHIVQADLFSMPFRPASFDMAYSIGVLQFTPDVRQAFASVSSRVKPRGDLAVYLYGDYMPGRRMSDLLRRLTTRLPRRWMFGLTAGCVPLYYLYRLPTLRKILPLLLPISLHPVARWRWLDTFDWYTPKYQWKLSYPEVFRLFRDHGYVDLQVFDEPIRIRGTKRIEHSTPFAQETR